MTQRKFATEAGKLFAAVANCSEQVVNQNANVAAEVCKVARKRTSGLTVKFPAWLKRFPHCLHSYGFSPVWVLKCVFKFPAWLKHFPHCLHS